MESDFKNDGYSEDDAIKDLEEIGLEDMGSLGSQERSAQIIPDKSELGPALDDDEDDNPDCGWFQCRPSFIQCFNRPAGYILIISLFSIAQSTTVNGLVYVVTTTLEKRFNLTSARSGSISSMYDLSTMIVIIFVTYFGERAHKPVWLGTGALIFAAGSFFFTLPHFLTGNYEYGSSQGDLVCNINSTAQEDCLEEDDEGNLSRYYFFFLAAQLLHGLGAAPLYTLGQAYVYDNCAARYAAVYIAIFQVSGNFAPAIGYIGGGLLLSTYTDIRMRDETDIDSSNPLWVGNWWLGFMFTGALALSMALPLMAFPKRLPGARRIELERKKTAQKGSEFIPSGKGGFSKIVDLPKAVFNILKNIPCLCIYFAIGAEFFIVASISVFGPKFIESQFGLSAGEAAIFAGVVVIPSALGGVLLGGWMVKWFDWAFRGTIRFIVFSLALSWVMMLVLLADCPNVTFAGVTVKYEDSQELLPLGSSNITALCNEDCQCGNDYDPVCGSNDVMYYTACHAGCTVVNDTGTEKDILSENIAPKPNAMSTVTPLIVSSCKLAASSNPPTVSPSWTIIQNITMNIAKYFNCGCITQTPGDSYQGGTATQGKCDQDCEYQSLFFAFIFFILFLTFIIVAPSVTALLSIVDKGQRTLSLGLQSLFYRLLGTIPAPIIFGKLIDNSCMIWEDECNGQRTCWLYDNREFAKYLLLVLFVCRAISLLLWNGSLLFYKPEEETKVDEFEDKSSVAVVTASKTVKSNERQEEENGSSVKPQTVYESEILD